MSRELIASESSTNLSFFLPHGEFVTMAKAPTKSEVYGNIASATGLTKKEIAAVFKALLELSTAYITESLALIIFSKISFVILPVPHPRSTIDFLS